MDMTIDELEGGVTSVVLRGRLDTKGAGLIDLRFNAIAGARHAVVVDLSEVDFLASLGIRVLLIGAKTIGGKGGRMVLYSPDERITMVLRAAGMDSLVPVFAERDAAMAALHG